MKNFLLLTFLFFLVHFGFSQSTAKMLTPSSQPQFNCHASYSHNGKYILFSDQNTGALKLFSAQNGAMLHNWTYKSVTLFPIFSPDDKFILVPYWDGITQLISLETKKIVKEYNFKGASLCSFSSKSDLFIQACTGGKLFLCDTKGKIIYSKNIEGVEYFTGLKFSSDDKYFGVTTYDDTIRIYESKSGKLIHKLNAATKNDPLFFQFMDNNILVANYDNGNIFEFDLKKGIVLNKITTENKTFRYSYFKNHNQKFDSKGKFFLFKNLDKEIKIKKVSEFTNTIKTINFSDTIIDFALSDNSEYIIAITKDTILNYSIQIYSLLKNNIIKKQTYKEYNPNIGTTKILISPDNQSILLDLFYEIKILNLNKNLEELFSIEPNAQSIVFAEFIDNDRLFTINTEGYFNTIDLADFENANSSQHQNRIFDKIYFWDTDQHIAINKRKKTFYVQSNDSTIKEFEISSGNLINSIRIGNGYNGGIAFSKDHKKVAVYTKFGVLTDTNNNYRIKVIDIENNKVISERKLRYLPQSETVGIASILLSSKSNYFTIEYSGNYDGIAGILKMYDIESGIEQKITQENTKFNDLVTTSNDEKLLFFTKHNYPNPDTGIVYIFDIDRNKIIDSVIGHEGYINSISSSDDDRYIISSCDDHSVIVYDLLEKRKLITIKDSVSVIKASMSPDQTKILTLGANGVLSIYNTITGNCLFHYQQLKKDDWLVYDNDFRYDGTENARKILKYICDDEIVDIKQFRDELYVPSLATRILKGQEIQNKKLSDLDICGTLPVVKKIKNNDSNYHYQITKRKFAIDRIEILVNKKTIRTIKADSLIFKNNTCYLDISYQEISRYFVPTEENNINVIAVSKAEGYELKSRGTEYVDYSYKEKKGTPSLYAIMVGINDYKDSKYKLNYGAADAKAISSLIKNTSTTLLGKDHVFLYELISDNKGTDSLSAEKQTIKNVFKSIGERINPEDIFFVFFAGHGVLKGKDSCFTLLTQESTNDNQIGISTKELSNWLSPEGPFNFKANKSIMILDACYSGQANKELYSLVARGEDDESDRIKQIDDLKEKSGVYILASASGSQSAYEDNEYQHGLLTYSLLSTIKNNSSILKENKYLNISKWFSESGSYLNSVVEKRNQKQSAQPFGTVDLNIGIIDDSIRSAIILSKEKPTIICTEAEEIKTLEDNLFLKDRLNEMLRKEAKKNSFPFSYIENKSLNTNCIKLKYEIKKDKVFCNVYNLVNEKRTSQVITTENYRINQIDELLNEIISALENRIK